MMHYHTEPTLEQATKAAAQKCAHESFAAVKAACEKVEDVPEGEPTTPTGETWDEWLLTALDQLPMPDDGITSNYIEWLRSQIDKLTAERDHNVLVVPLADNQSVDEWLTSLDSWCHIGVTYHDEHSIREIVLEFISQLRQQITELESDEKVDEPTEIAEPLAKLLKLVNNELATAEAALLVAARDKLCRGHRFDGGAYRDEYEIVAAYKQQAKQQGDTKHGAG